MASTAKALRDGAARLAAAGIPGARLEARLLLAHALGLPAERLLLQRDAVVDGAAFDRLLTRRAAHEPLARITGHREFWSLDFAVTADTLVPRPDSETLIEAALAAFPTPARVRRVLDLGTGTGCLLLAALHEFPAAFGVGVDRVPAAAALAARNAASLGLAGRAAMLCGDWAAALDGGALDGGALDGGALDGGPLNGRFDLVLCNPPYIPSAEIGGLMPEVARYEPASALAGGTDGLDAYRAVLPCLTGLLQPAGVAILELGQGQAGPVMALARRHGLVGETRADLACIARALVLRDGCHGGGA